MARVVLGASPRFWVVFKRKPAHENGGLHGSPLGRTPPFWFSFEGKPKGRPKTVFRWGGGPGFLDMSFLGGSQPSPCLLSLFVFSGSFHLAH